MLKNWLNVKRANKNKIAWFFLALAFLVETATAQISPFNKRAVKDTSGVYSFIISGHFHGESSNASTFPASTILAGIDTINSLEPRFLMSLGDMFLDVDDTYIRNYDRSLFRKLKAPLFNAVGNHDLSNGNMYEKIYGQTYYTFRTGTEYFIVLNTEINDGSIKNEQLDFLKRAVDTALMPGIKNVFICSHRPVWSENNIRYKDLFAGNTRTAIGKNNFDDVIEPLINKISRAKNIYWISGSLANGPASFFYDRNDEAGITYMQTAIRDLPRDAILMVTSDNGKISFKGVSLTGQNIEAVENYNLSYWKANCKVKEPFNFRLLPYMIMRMLLHYYFWTGFLFSFLLFFALRTLFKKWKRKE
jgi:hypothetical protein